MMILPGIIGTVMAQTILRPVPRRSGSGGDGDGGGWGPVIVLLAAIGFLIFVVLDWLIT